MAGNNSAGGSGIGAVVGAAGGLLQQHQSQWYLGRSYRQQNKYAKQLFDYESAVNDAYTRRLGEDAASIDVLSRRKAGLNPYASEGQVGATPVSNSMPSPHAEGLPNGNVGIDALSGMRMMAEIDNIKADTKAKQNNNDAFGERNALLNAEIQARIDNLNSNTNLTDAERQTAETNLNLLKDSYDEILKQRKMTSQQMDNAIKLQLKELDFKDEEIQQIRNVNSTYMQEFQARIELLRSQRRINDAQAAAAYGLCKVYAEQANNLHLDGQFLDQSMAARINTANMASAQATQSYQITQALFPSEKELKEASAKLKSVQAGRYDNDKDLENVVKILSVATQMSNSGAKWYDVNNK